MIYRLPLLFIILAISALCAPLFEMSHVDSSLGFNDTEKRLDKAEKLFRSSKRASAYSEGSMQQCGDIMMVMADLLTARYLILVRRAPAASTMLGTAIARAQALGLHRHHSAIGDIDREDLQERQLVWS